MVTNFWFFALLFALVIVLGLAIYAYRLLRQLAKQKAYHAKLEAEQQASLKLHDKKVLDSALLITRAMQQEQCEFDEGCWRLSVLLASLKTLSGLQEKFPNIFSLYETIKELAILEARKALSKKERMREDYQRMMALEKYHDAIKSELGSLHQYLTEQLELI